MRIIKQYELKVGTGLIKLRNITRLGKRADNKLDFGFDNNKFFVKLDLIVSEESFLVVEDDENKRHQLGKFLAELQPRRSNQDGEFFTERPKIFTPYVTGHHLIRHELTKL